MLNPFFCACLIQYRLALRRVDEGPAWSCTSTWTWRTDGSGFRGPCRPWPFREIFPKKVRGYYPLPVRTTAAIGGSDTPWLGLSLVHKPLHDPTSTITKTCHFHKLLTMALWLLSCIWITNLDQTMSVYSPKKPSWTVLDSWNCHRILFNVTFSGATYGGAHLLQSTAFVCTWFDQMSHSQSRWQMCRYILKPQFTSIRPDFCMKYYIYGKSSIAWKHLWKFGD